MKSHTSEYVSLDDVLKLFRLYCGYQSLVLHHEDFENKLRVNLGMLFDATAVLVDYDFIRSAMKVVMEEQMELNPQTFQLVLGPDMLEGAVHNRMIDVA